MSDLVVVGDWNGTYGDVDALAAAIEGTTMRGHSVDYAVGRGAVPIRRLVIRAHGSDHNPILYTFKLSDGSAFTVLSWNVDQGQSPASVLTAVASLVDRFQPDVVQLSEAYRCRKVLRRIPGYKRYQGLNVGEGADVAVLVRRNIPVRAAWAMRMHEPWSYKGRPRRPRVYRVVRLVPHGHVVRFLGVHLPTRNSEDAQAESYRRIRRWAR